MSAIYEVLRQLDEWRHLPAYQLERRVDIFFGMFLPKVIERRFGLHVDEDIPEFPLHKGKSKISEDPEDHHSVKVDFVVFGRQANKKRMFLIELKTDIGSLNADQLKNMENARGANSKDLLQGVIDAAQHSDSKHKYAHLVWKLLKLKCLGIDNLAEITNMQLGEIRPGLTSAFKTLGVGKEWCNACVDVVVVLPEESEGLEPYPEFHSITFDQFAETLETGYKPFVPEDVRTFLAHVRDWAHVRAGRVSPWPQQH